MVFFRMNSRNKWNFVAAHCSSWFWFLGFLWHERKLKTFAYLPSKQGCRPETHIWVRLAGDCYHAFPSQLRIQVPRPGYHDEHHIATQSEITNLTWSKPKTFVVPRIGFINYLEFAGPSIKISHTHITESLTGRSDKKRPNRSWKRAIQKCLGHRLSICNGWPFLQRFFNHLTEITEYAQFSWSFRFFVDFCSHGIICLEPSIGVDQRSCKSDQQYKRSAPAAKCGTWLTVHSFFHHERGNIPKSGPR